MNDITVTKNDTAGRWDVEYTADQAATVTKTMETGGTILDRDIHIEVTVPTGTEGTPVATKGAVSGNAVSVTPSVTNTAGFITGGTLMGTPVSVSASELVSGTKSITASGTTDVTNYASASVASGSAATPATSITANPSISVSSGGVITASVSATKSVTPSVSAGFVSAGTAGTITVSGSASENLSTQAAQTITPTTSNIVIPSGKYLTGAQTILGDANLVAANIAKDVSIFGVTGTHEGGGGGWELIGEWNETINTSSTSEVVIGTYTTTHTFSTSDDIYAVVVMDKAGKQNGHFVAEYSLSFPERTSGAWSTHRSFFLGYVTRYASSTWYSAGYFGKNNGSWFGIYGQRLDQADGITTLTLAGKYKSGYTGTINGNFNIRLFRLPFPQNGNPYNFSFT